MDVRKMLDENVCLKLWPDVGAVLRLKRGAVYAAKRRGEIETMKFGHLERVPVAWLKRKLGLAD